MSKLPTIHSFSEPNSRSPFIENQDLSAEDMNLLKEHIRNMKNFWHPPIGGKIKNQDFKAHSMKRADISNCDFADSSFERSVATNSNWNNVSLKNCIFKMANLSYSEFDSTQFLNCYFSGSLINTIFTGSCFKNCEFLGANFTNSLFCGGAIKDCDIKSSTFEGARFKETLLQNMSLNNLNIEYCDVTEAKLENVTLSLAQFPYIFGITPLQIESEAVKISTDFVSQFPQKYIDWENLLKIINVLVNFFNTNHDYFPIANLYLSSGLDNQFYDVVEHGIRFSLLGKKYRQLSFLCKLAKISKKYSSNDLEELYYLIKSLHEDCKENEFEMLQYNLHMGDIKSYLIPSKDSGDMNLKITIQAIKSKSDISCIALCMDHLHESAILLGFDFFWSQIELTKINPIKSIIRIKIGKNTGQQQGLSKFEKITVFLHLITVLFIGTTSTLDLKRYINESQMQELKKMKIEIHKHLEIKYINVDSGTKILLRTNQSGDAVIITENIEQSCEPSLDI